MQFHGIPWNLECANFDDTSSSVEFHGIPWNSRIEWKTVNLIFFLGCQSWHCFWLSGKSSWFFNIQEVWFMQIMIFDVLLMRPCVNTLPLCVEQKEMDMFGQSYVLLIYILHILIGCLLLCCIVREASFIAFSSRVWHYQFKVDLTFC